MTLAYVLLWLLIALLLIAFVRRLWRFFDESAQYQLELKQLRKLGLEEVGGQPVRRWICRLYVSPRAVRQYRQVRGG